MSGRVEAQNPGREVSREEYAHICHRYAVAGRLVAGRLTGELACGAGLAVGYLSGLAARYVGADLAWEHIVLARRNSRAAAFMRLDCEHLPFRGRSFQTLLALEVAQYLNIPRFLEELRAVLADDGVALITLPNCRRRAFQPSARSREYLDSDGWRAACAPAGLHAVVLGAFREASVASRARRGFGLSLVHAGSHALNAIDPQRRLGWIRAGLRRAIGYKPLRLPERLPTEDIVEAGQRSLTRLVASVDAAPYAFLYILVGPNPATVDDWVSRVVGAAG